MVTSVAPRLHSDSNYKHALLELCVTHTKGMQPSFVKLLLSFQIAYNLEFLILHNRPWRVPWLHGCGKSAIYPWDHY